MNTNNDYEKAKIKLNEQKELLIRKKEEIANLNIKLGNIQQELESLNKMDRNECDLNNKIQIESIKMKLLSHERKANILKNLNIKNYNFTLFGSEFKYEKPLDNLIKTIFILADKKFLNFDLNFSSYEQKQCSNVDEKIIKVKKDLLLDEQTPIDQLLVQKICNYLRDNFFSDQNMAPCELLSDSLEISDLSQKYLLYEFENDFILLRQNNLNESLDSRLAQSVRNLLNEELLDELCILKFNDLLNQSFHEADINEVFKCLNLIKSEIGNENDGHESKFLDFIKIKEHAERAEDFLLSKELKKCAELYNDSTQDENLSSQIKFLEEAYLKRIDEVVTEECERRKKLSEFRISSECRSGSKLQREIFLKKKKIDENEKEMSLKEKELKAKEKSIERVKKNIEQLEQAYANQAQDIQFEIDKIEQTFRFKETEFVKQQTITASLKLKVDQTHNNLNDTQSMLVDLNKKRDEAIEKLNECRRHLETFREKKLNLEKKKSNLNMEKSEFVKKKQDLINVISDLNKWSEFLNNVYNELLNNRNLFSKRKSFAERLETAKSLIEKYEILVKETKIKNFALENFCQQNNYARRDELENCLRNVLAEPKLAHIQSTVEITGLNLNYSETEKKLDHFVKQQLRNARLCLNDQEGSIILYTEENDPSFNYSALYNQKIEVTDELRELIDRLIKVNYVIKDVKLDEKGRLTEETEIAEIGKLGDIKLQDILTRLKIDQAHLIPCFCRTLKILAGNNVYIDKQEVKLKSINIVITAGQDIILPKQFILDTSGFNGQQFEFKIAYGEKTKAGKLQMGKNGQDGFDGMSGYNGGNVYITAARRIENLESIKLLNVSGGFGSDGQKGGNGQTGGVGEDTGDAEAEDFTAPILKPKFAAAFARIPGYNTETNKFDNENEKSGNGGNGGKNGFGGALGFAGKILIKDEKDFIRTNAEDSEKFDLSLNQSFSFDRIKAENGKSGSKQNERAEGGDAGLPGSYGWDHVFCAKTGNIKKESNKGDYSNFLLEKRVDQVDEFSNKYKKASIFDEPDLYAKMSKLTAISGTLGIFTAGFVCFMISPFVMAVLPVVGVGGIISTIIAGYSMAAIGTIAVGVVGIIQIFTTISGLVFKTGVEKGKENKNRLQIMFNNRYCDEPPLMFSTDANNKRRDERSRGKKGEQGADKDQEERQEHSKSKEKRNEFNDAVDVAAMNKKVAELQRDVKQKSKAFESIQNEIQKQESLVEAVELKVNELSAQTSQVDIEVNSIESQINEQKVQFNQIEQTLSSIQSLMSQAEGKLSDTSSQLLTNIDSYLNSIEEQASFKISLEILKLKQTAKTELLSEIKMKCAAIRGELQDQISEITGEKSKIQKQFERKNEEKVALESEIEALKEQEMNGLLSRVSNEKQIAELAELQRKLKVDNQNNRKTNSIEQTLVSTEFKMRKKNRNQPERKPKTTHTLRVNCLVKQWESMKPKDLVVLERLVKLLKEDKTQDFDLAMGQLDFIIYFKSSEINFEEDSNQKKQDLKTLLNDLCKKPMLLKGIYIKLGRLYFSHKKLNLWASYKTSNFLESTSLHIHYTTAELSELEERIIEFGRLGAAALQGKQNILNTVELLKDYMAQVDRIAQFEWPFKAVLNGNVNSFYTYLINLIKTRLSQDSAWNDLNYLLDLIDLIKEHVNNIDSLTIWKSCGLMRLEIQAANTLNTQRKEKNELDKLKLDFSMDFYKLELIEQHLQPKLIESILNTKSSLPKYLVIKEKIIKSIVSNREEKEMLDFALNKEFMSKKKFFLGEKKIAGLTLSPECVRKLTDTSQVNDFLLLLVNNSLNFEHLLALYNEAGEVKEATVRARIESALSVQLESMIIERVDKRDVASFRDAFDQLLKSRLTTATNHTIIVKSALFDNTHSLVTKSPLSEAIFVLQQAVGHIVFNSTDSLEFSKKDIQFLQNLGLEPKLNACQIYESLLFRICRIQLEILNQSFLTTEESRKVQLNTEFTSLCKKILDLNTNNVGLNGVKAFVERIEQAKKLSEKARLLTKYLDNNDMAKFFQVLEKTRNGLSASKLIELSFEFKYASNEWQSRNKKLMLLVEYFDKNLPRNDIELDELVNMFELNEIINQDDYSAMFSFTKHLNSLKNIQTTKRDQILSGVRKLISSRLARTLKIIQEVELAQAIRKPLLDYLTISNVDLLDEHSLDLITKLGMFFTLNPTHKDPSSHIEQLVQNTLIKIIDCKSNENDFLTQVFECVQSIAQKNVNDIFVLFFKLKIEDKKVLDEEKIEKLVNGLKSTDLRIELNRAVDSSYRNDVKLKLDNLKSELMDIEGKLETSRQEILDYYRKLIGVRNELAKKARINFITGLVYKIDASIDDSFCFGQRLEIYSNLSELIRGLSTRKDIETVLIDKINNQSLSVLSKEIENFFGQSPTSIVHLCTIVTDDLLHKTDNRLKQSNALDYVQLMDKIFNRFYFDTSEEQTRIDETRKQLIKASEKLNDQVRERVNKLTDQMVKSCYRLNSFMKFCDTQSLGQLKLIENWTDIDLIEQDFARLSDNISLANETFNQFISKFAFKEKILKQLDGLSEQITDLNKAEIKKKLVGIDKEMKTQLSGPLSVLTESRQKIKSYFVNELFDKIAAMNEKEWKLMDSVELGFFTSCVREKFEKKLSHVTISLDLKKRFTLILTHLNTLPSLRLKFIFTSLYSKSIFNEKCFISHEELNKVADFISQHVLGLEATPSIDLIINNWLLKDKQQRDSYCLLLPLLCTKNIELIENFVHTKSSVNVNFKPLLVGLCNFFDKSRLLDENLQQINDRLYTILVKDLEACQPTHKSLSSVYFCLDKFKDHKSVMDELLKSLEYDYLRDKLLGNSESNKLAVIVGEKKTREILVKMPHLWKDELDNEYLICVSQVLLRNVKESKTLSMANVQHLIKATYFDTVDKFKKNFDSNGLESAVSLQHNLITLNEIVNDRFKLIEFFEAMQKRVKCTNTSLDEINEIFSLAMLFENLNGLSELVRDTKSVSELVFEAILYRLRSLFIKMFSEKEVEKKSEEILYMLRKSLVTVENNFLKLLLSKVRSDYSAGVQYKTSEIELIKKNLQHGLAYGLFEQLDVLNQLNDTPVLKWTSTLKKASLLAELNVSGDCGIIDDILCIESRRGEHLTKRFVKILKSIEIDELVLEFLVQKFKRNEWDLSESLLDLLETNSDTNQWIQIINKHDISIKRKELSAQEIVNEMKKLEGTLEINNYVSYLIDRPGGHQSLIETCVKKLDQIKCSTCVRVTSEADSFDKEISTYDPKDIRQWADEYKQVNKVDINTIDSPVFLELVAVISRASLLVNTHELRTTQKIALLIFIDSIVNKTNGRLANISTGEGKSLITISITLAQLLIKGGNVDVLTSSEILAERDADESRSMFGLFGFSVSNNCDAKASMDEKVRKDRYEKNEIVYGEIGHFQRDLLLTKYYDKDIRKKLATCLIVDEVDSMCIDNICNTLYISHQIADLRLLKALYVHVWKAVNDPELAEFCPMNEKKVKEYVQKLIDDGLVMLTENLREFVERRLSAWIKNAYEAKDHIEEGNHYSILSRGKRIGEAVINDLQTGVEQMNTQWSDGLQQFIQLKHTNKLTDESLKAIFMSNYIFFNEYHRNIYGMTGTLGGSLERDLLNNAYGLDFFQLPRFKKELNIRQDDILTKNRTEWIEAIKKDVLTKIAQKAMPLTNESELRLKKSQLESQVDELRRKESSLRAENKTVDLKSVLKDLGEKCIELEDVQDTLEEDNRCRGGRAVLIICENKKDANELVKALSLKHRHVFDYFGKIDGLRKIHGGKKTPVELDQLRPGDIIIATNIAGRGTDLKISRLVNENGGLHVIMSYVPVNIRVELQGFGRSGRKGETGSGRMIVRDSRADFVQSVDFLREERDEAEENRLKEIRLKMIPRVKIEKELFDMFEKLQEKVKKHFTVSINESKYRALQMKSLHNKWAFWLDKMSNKINSVEDSSQNRSEILNEFDILAKSLIRKVEENFNESSIGGLVDEPGEIVKLIKLNIELGDFEMGRRNCDYMIGKFGVMHDPFAYYYKAVCLFQPYIESEHDSFASIKKVFKKHHISYEERRKGIDALKNSIILFENEIDSLKNLSLIMSPIASARKSGGIGSTSDYFSKSNTNEIAALTVHLNAAKSALSQEIVESEMAHALKGDILDENQARELIDFTLTNEKLKFYIKELRLSKKVRVRWHLKENDDECVKKILDEETYKNGIRNFDSNAQKQKINVEYNQKYLIVDKISEEQEQSLLKNEIEFKKELYVEDRLNGGYRLVQIPSKFNYCKDKILLSIQELNTEKLWNLLNKNFAIERCFTKGENLLDSNEIWKSALLETHSNEIRKKLDEIFKQSSEINVEQLSLPDQLDHSKIIDELINAKCLKETYKFSDSVIEKLICNSKLIILNKNVELDKLQSKIDLTEMQQLNEDKAKILTFLVENKQMTISDLNNIMNEENKAQNSLVELFFKILKNLLIVNEFSPNIFDCFNLKQNFNKQEIFLVETLVYDFHEKKRFTIDSLEEHVASSDQLYSFLKAQKVFKPKCFFFALNAQSNTLRVDNFVNIVETLVNDKIEARINFLIEKDTFVTEKELDLIIESKSYLSLAYDKLRENWSYNENENFRQMLKTEHTEVKKKEQKQKLVELVKNLFLDKISPLKRFESVCIETRDLKEYFTGGNLPRETTEYSRLSRDLVFSFSENHSLWTWKAVAVAAFGMIQITAGAFLMAYPFLGHWSYSIGSSLIAEGASDFSFAITNGGNGYMNHKIWSLAFTIPSMVIGGLFSSGAHLAEFSVKLSKRFIIKTVLKKSLGEIFKVGLNLIKAKIANFISSVVTKELFQRLKNGILSLLKSLPLANFKQRLDKITLNIKKMRQHMNLAELKSFLNEKLSEAEKEMNETIESKISSFVGKLGGPVVSQLSQAAETVQFSGLKLNEDKKLLENTKASIITKLIGWIQKLLNYVQNTRNFLELKNVLYDLLRMVDKKIQHKLEQSSNVNTKTETMIAPVETEVFDTENLTVIRDSSFATKHTFRTDNKEDNVDEEEKENVTIENTKHDVASVDELGVKECVNQVEDRLYQNLQSKIENNFLSPYFSSLIEHAFKPLNNLLESHLFQDFNQLKTRALAYGEYDHRYEKDIKNKNNEKGLELELVKNELTQVLNQIEKNFKIESPVKEKDLDDIKEGKLSVQVDGEMRELDLAKDEDRKFIKNRFGDRQLRILPGDPPRLSRPNFLNYMESWDVDKQMNETDLVIIASMLGRQIVVKTEDGNEKCLGPASDKKPIRMELVKKSENNEGHFSPEGVKEIKNVGNSCAIESILFVIERENLINEGKEPDVAKQLAHDKLREAKCREDFIFKIKKFAQTSECMRDLFLGRQHETTEIIGGKANLEFIMRDDVMNFIGTNKKYDDMTDDEKEIYALICRFGGSYEQGNNDFFGRSYLGEACIEINHAPRINAYKGTPYKEISPDQMPSFAMLRSDHRIYPTTENSSENADYNNQLNKLLKEKKFNEALKLEIKTTLQAEYHKGDKTPSVFDYSYNLIKMINYCEEEVIKGCPLNKDNEKKLITKSEANELRKLVIQITRDKLFPY
ncbi:unnamed protein product [Brachionus calyciflorus]|uniref:Uncharacterized protein n=1 Tax=Brachionus calyciflorus TaxID=104777 RepID=A0A813RTZ8_9BILA|nr:unnamed protein product [Brachionus calyciflorus]